MTGAKRVKLTLGEALGVVGEDDAGGHELGEDLEELRVVQHALLHAAVEELVVVRDDLVDRRHGVKPLHHRVPVRLQHLVNHVSTLSPTIHIITHQCA